MIILVAAYAHHRVIGYQGKMPWHLPADLKHFKQITMGHTIVMGRKTYDSIGKPLPGRNNIVLSTQKDFLPEQITVVHHIHDILNRTTEDLYIIGGANLYTQFLPMADRLYLTEIEAEYTGDTFFPTIDQQDWKTIEATEHAPDALNTHAYRFLTLDRVQK